MRTLPRTLWTIGLVLAALAMVVPTPTEAQPCNDVSWLTPGTPPPMLYDVNQAAGTSNCQFHEFASQNFLALFLGDSPAIAQWPTIDDVLRKSGAPNCSEPSPLGTGLTPVIGQNGFNSIAQAKGPPLVDQSGRYIQYDVRVSPSLCQSIDSCELYNSDCVVKATFDSSFQFPRGTTTTLGTAEAKLGWRVLETCNLPDSPKPCTPDLLEDYFWVQGTVQPYSPTDSSAHNVTLGLIAFHLAQQTPTHPEMIWATWEHLSNAPVCPNSANTPSAQACKDPSMPGPNGWAIYNPNCVGPYCTQNTPPPSTVSPQPVSQICRENACGGGELTLTDVSNQQNIASLNQAIRGKVADVWWNYFLVGTLWTNNGMVPETNPKGSTCVACKSGAAPPCVSPDKCSTYQYDPTVGNERGSTLLANSAVESWDQWTVGGTQSNSDLGYNCFTGCHQFANSGSTEYGFANIDFVHILIHAQQGTATKANCSVDLAGCLMQKGH